MNRRTHIAVQSRVGHAKDKPVQNVANESAEHLARAHQLTSSSLFRR